MRAELKSIHSPDVWDLQNYRPVTVDNFGFLIQLMVGTAETKGQDAFSVVVCTPEWLRQRYSSADILVGRHHLIIFEYNYDRLMSFLRNYCSNCIGETWEEIANRMGRLAHWEYEDFKPTVR
jgi:hypothetical protein